ncbi:MAG: helix-turn-helix transcriptional regulator [Clostridia bacterium]|nr:helix-turn-helix transcriptional regulator [Clostridia bacterium]
MKPRVNGYDTRNLIGRRVESLRKAQGIKQKDFIARLQVAGLDINPTSYSKLEGQARIATDKEVYVIAQVLGVAMEKLFDGQEDIK